MAILNITCPLALSPLNSPIAASADGSIQFSKPVTSSLKMRPILSTWVTMPVATNVAQTLIAIAASSGDESAAKAGVNADPICAWYCSRREASTKSGSGVLPKSFKIWSRILKPHTRSSITVAVEAENAIRTLSPILPCRAASAGIVLSGSIA